MEISLCSSRESLSEALLILGENSKYKAKMKICNISLTICITILANCFERSTDAGFNYRLCHANVWNKDKNESKVIATFTKNNDILVSRGGFDNFYS